MELIYSGKNGAATEESTFASPHRWLPATLALIAGMVDLTSFVSLNGIFTAHVTGNIVVLVARAIEGRHPELGQALAVPVFMVTAAAVWLLVRKIGFHHAAATRAVLFLQFLLLLAVLLFSVAGHATRFPTSTAALAAVLLAAAAMAAQNSLLHLQVAGSPSTAVMTGNLVSAVLLTFDAVSTDHARRTAARSRLRNVLELLGGFILGCSIAAVALRIDRAWAWALPVALAGVSVTLVPIRSCNGGRSSVDD